MNVGPGKVKINLMAITFLTVLSILVNCRSERDEYYFEDRMLKCFEDVYAQHGLDLYASIDSASSTLVKYNVLIGKDGRSYIQFIETLKAAGELPVKPSRELIEILRSINLKPPAVRCKDKISTASEAAALSRSKFRHAMDIMEAVEKNDFSIEVVCDEILKVYTERDFDHRFYSTVATLAIARLVMKTDEDLNIVQTLPPPPQIDFSRHPNLHVLHLELTSDDKLNVNDEEMNLEKAGMKIESMILTFGKDLAFSVTSKKSTSHRLFTDVVDGLIAGNYNRIRDKYALEQYKKTFGELDEDLQKDVREKYPIIISIAPPTP